MSRLMKLMSAPVTATLLIAAVVTASAHDGGPEIGTPEGDIAFELVGQVQNIPATPTSYQYGYLSTVEGIDSAFTTTPHNEASALFTFYTTATTTQVIDNGNLRIVDRTGTTTIYLHDNPNGSFSLPSTFADGLPVMTMSLKQQVVLDLTNSTFTTVNINTVTAAQSFTVNGTRYRFAQERDQFRTVLSGRPNTTGTQANFVIAGYVVPTGRDNNFDRGR